MNQITVTIAIPVFNGEKFLKEAIESALNQTVPADEILVFIHDTQDKSRIIAEEFLPKVRIVEENTNLNIGQAWNRLYEISQSDYVIMLHADDKLTKNAVQKIKNAINKNLDVGLIFGRSYFNKLDEEEIYLTNFNPEEIPEMSPYQFQLAMLTKGFLPFCSGLCISRKLMVDLKFNENFSLILDLEFFHRILYFTKGLVLTDIISIYRKHQDSTLHTAKLQNFQQDFTTWIREIEDGAINIPDEFRDEYKGFVLRRLSIFYSNLIYSLPAIRLPMENRVKALPLRDHL